MFTTTHTHEMSQDTALETTGTKLQSRFGEITYNQDKVIEFPNGLLGMPGQTSFAIAAMPVEKLQKFQVMQSMVDQDTSFAVLSHDLVEDKIDEADLKEICEILEFDL